jgi:hypothetical protein
MIFNCINKILIKVVPNGGQTLERNYVIGFFLPPPMKKDSKEKRKRKRKQKGKP